MQATAVRPDDIVKVVNREEYPITVKWNSREYRLAPGVDTFVPGACAFLWFGDPRSSGVYQSIPDPDGSRMFVSDRATEVRRLRIKWGAGLEGDEASFDGVAVPQVEVWTAEGERVTTVLDDPDGRNVISASPSIQDDEGLRQLVAKQQRQIEMMKQHIGLNDDEKQAAADESELPRDGDTVDLASGDFVDLTQ